MNNPDSNSNRITVRSGSRLHFGLFSSPPPSQRFFHGAGMMIDSPGFTISAKVIDSNQDIVKVEKSNGEVGERIREVAQKFRELTGSNLRWEIDTRSTIPLHNGLGGGTQLALTVAFALSKLSKIEIHSPKELAQLAGRGKRSSIGTFGFFRGGFLIDDGKENPDDFGNCKVQLSVPDIWRILLVTPKEQHGLAGSAEIEAFKKLPPLNSKTAEQLNSILHNDMLKAVKSADLQKFQDAVHTFGQIVGQQFSSVQHGVYATAFAQQIADALISRGIGGIGQTSWGPTLFGFFESSEEKIVLEKVRSICEIDKCEVRISKPKNDNLDFTFD